MRTIFTIFIFVLADKFVFGQLPAFPLNACEWHSPLGCDEFKILQFSGHGQIVNGQREGFWYESVYRKPYAMGKYSNGKKDSVWQFFHLLKFDTTKTNLADIKDFQKAKLFCSATFKEGRLNGAYKRFDLKTKMFILSKYKNDTLIDTLTTFLENGKINYVSNYNNVYYDTLWRHSRGETTYLKERLPYTTQYCYLRQKDYVTFEGYTDAVWYLVFDKKTKKLKKDKAGFDACELHKTERAEGVYKMVVDNTTATEFQIEDGRKHRIKDISLDK